MASEDFKIAVIGFGCRLPGGVTNGQKLWQMLMEKRSARTEVPTDRYNVEAFYHPDGNRYGTSNNRGGHFLTEDVSLFDAPFFSISPAEAIAMDPMQRILLEVTYEALENSGLTLDKISGSKTSCFVGCFTKDYEEMQRRDMELAPKYQSTGASQTMLSNRLSYFYNFKGPSITLDTACSSGLVAVHLACQSLRTGESSMSVVGGSNLILSPDIQIEMSDMNFLSPDSVSYAFDERANGYARGEGMGIIVLKPLHLALRDNDPIRAVIRGTAASSDGRTPGITMPSKDAQIDLIRSAYLAAGCDVSETGYFEAHGTGTAAGDPIETGAIGEIFAAHRPSTIDGAAIPLSVGSLKTNMGHLEGASGIAGLIKAILSVEQGMITPNIWFEKGNPAIEFDRWRIKVPTEPMAWPLEGIRRASVNSFGYGGTNAHVILDNARHHINQTSRSSGHTRTDSGSVELVDEVHLLPSSRPRVFFLSANDEPALKRISKALAEHLQTLPPCNEEQLLDRLAYTLCERRSRFPHVHTVVASDLANLERRLNNVNSISHDHIDAPRIGFIFTGQGAQWWGMGRELLRYPVFKDSIHRCDAIIRDLGADWSLKEELLRNEVESRVDEAPISQPLCTALQIALVNLHASWNIHPHSVVGHSSGEIAAAYAAGALSARSAMTIAFFRGLLAPKVKNLGYAGSMMAAALSEDDANHMLAGSSSELGQVRVACINSPRSVTFSGDTTAIEELHKALVAKGIFAKILQVDTAYHSHHMQAIAEEYLARLREANVTVLESDQQVQMFSSVTEDIVERKQLGLKYWVTNLIGCVRFSGALEKLCLSVTESNTPRVDILLEIGPHSLFKVPVRDVLSTAFGGTPPPFKYLSTLIRGKPADVTALEVASHLFTDHYPVEIHTVNFPVKPKHSLPVLTDLPQYSWNHSRSYWCESRFSRDYRFRQFPRTGILGAPVYDWNPIEPRFRNFLRLREQPWLRDHVVQGDILFPACGYICMAIEACRQMCVISPSTFLPEGSGSVTGYKLRDVSISRALLVPETDEGVEISFSMRRQANPRISKSDYWYEFHIFSFSVSGGWAENCCGSVSVISQLDELDGVSKNCQDQWTAARADCSTKLDVDAFYADVNAIGLTYGSLFQGIKDLTINPTMSNQAAAMIQVTDTRAANPHGFEHDRLLHPATIDSFLQLALVGLGGAGLEQLQQAMVPTFVEEIVVSGDIAAKAGDCLHVVANTQRDGYREAKADIFALDPVTSKAVVLMDGFRFVAINAGNTSSEVEPTIPKHCFKPVWEPDVELIERQDLDRELQAASRPEYRSKNARELELLAYYFIDQAIQKVDEDDVAAMLPHHQRFYANLCEIRDTVIAKTHPQQTEEWQRLHTPEVTLKLDAMAQYYRSHETAYDGKLLVRIGEALPSVFRHKVEPLALMTQENLLEDYYTTAVGMPNTYAQISRYLTMLSHKYPNLDYLEIGAGTGGATVPTLQGLSGCKDLHTYPRLKTYTYTDISSYFFERAAEKFQDFEKFTIFKKLDIEQDPEAQGFTPASYDVIVAANVLHATSDMNRTMAHARKLLRPGGKLILLEMTNRLLAASVIFGTLPGWWNASEDWRRGGPLLTEVQWEDVLRTNGFSNLQASSPDTQDPLEEGTRLMIATAVESPKASLRNGLPTPPESPRIFILCGTSPVKMNRLDVAIALKSTIEKTGVQAQILPFSRLKLQDVTGAICISLVELKEPVLADLEASDLETLRRIAETSAGLLWVTRGAASADVERPELALFHGLARTLRVEHREFPCITIDLSAEGKLLAGNVAHLLIRVYQEYLWPGKHSNTADSEFIEKNNVLYIKRAIVDDASNQFLAARTMSAVLPPQLDDVVQKNRPLRLKMSDNDSKSFVFEDDLSHVETLQPTDVEIEVHAMSLDAKHIESIKCTSSDNSPSLECAGVITKVGSDVTHLSIGDRVTAWCLGTFATHVRSTAACTHRIPDGMSFEVAASLPIAFATAHYALVHVARLKSGETILIHGATNAVGQAAIQLASTLGAEIFLTACSQDEEARLAATHNIESDHIFLHQDRSFVTALKQATNGRGVDVVLNVASHEALPAVFNCVASFGRFIDLPSSDIQTDGRAGMVPIGRNVSFTSIDMSALRNQNARLAGKTFGAVMELFTAGELREGSLIEVKPWSKLADAAASLQSDNHTDKLVMVPTAGDTVLVAQGPPEHARFNEDASYVLAGGLGGLGRSIARWMVNNGAKNLIFISRSGASSDSASSMIADLSASGVCTAVLNCDISDSASLSSALSTTLATFPPVRGVIQAAMSLNDSLFTNMSQEQWTDTIRPKVHGSKNLHEETLSQPLDFFILLSSLHSFIGNPGQANYGAGCAYQVALAQYRNGLGLPAVAIDLGIVDEVGYVVETSAKAGKNVVVQALQHIKETEMLGLIELAVREPFKGHIVTGLDGNFEQEKPFFAEDPILSHLEYLRPHIQLSPTTQHSVEGSTTQKPLSALLSMDNSTEMNTELIQTALIKKLSRSLMMDPEDLNASRSLSAYGTDSLVAVEMKNWIQRETKVSASVFEILQAPAISALAKRIAEGYGRKAEG